MLLETSSSFDLFNSFIQSSCVVFLFPIIHLVNRILTALGNGDGERCKKWNSRAYFSFSCVGVGCRGFVSISLWNADWLACMTCLYTITNCRSCPSVSDVFESYNTYALRARVVPFFPQLFFFLGEEGALVREVSDQSTHTHWKKIKKIHGLE